MNSTFEHLQTQTIDTLNLSVEAYRHKATGALHYHLNSDNSENVFLVALRTLPTDSTGVAHILEHTALCGSERFPVRDPFFMMIRRSLNTFMNAFTSSDWTAYPFATQNRKDFDHLLQVYLDAVFFSRLDPLDFAQEGHRMEFSEPENSDSELVFKGVVFNEMKGAMSSVNSTLWQAISKHLQVGTTYENNSGGEPADIPNLSHEQLLAFYKKHYHPSNAVFMTFGNIPAEDHQAKFEELVLARFEKQTQNLRAETQQRFTEPKTVEESYAYDDDASDIEKRHYFLLNWLLGDASNLQDSLEAQLMSGVLLENSSAPLQHFLETTDLGTSPSLSGVDTSSKEITFSCGLEGGKAEDIEKFESQILQVLEDIASNGIDQSLVESVLHQLELGQREITGNSYPYGLSLMLAALPAALHDGDPIQMLDLDKVLNQLRENIQDPKYIPSLIKKWLLDNTHRVRLLVKPDASLQEQKNQAEKARLAETAKQLSEPEKQAIIDQTKALAERQEQIDDPDVLPKLSLSDIPDMADFPSFESLKPLTTFYPQATNGLVYEDIRMALPNLSIEQLSLLPLLTSCMTELGAGDSDYLQMQQQQSASTGGVNAFHQIRRHQDGHIQAYWGITGKALSHKHSEAHDLITKTLSKVRFDEHRRIRELIQQIRSGAEKSITGSGHSLAMAAAASYHNPLAANQHIQSGLVSVKRIKALDDALNDNEQLTAFCQQLEQLYQTIQTSPADILLVAEKSASEKVIATTADITSETSTSNVSPFTFSPLSDTETPAQHQLWLTQTQVNFCAKAFPSVHFTHPDAPGLTVLGNFLRNGYLHRVIREQGGAYGGGASQDNRLGVFKFYSYRDPRNLDTLSDFDASIDWVLSSKHDQSALEEAIFTVISSIDKPSSPSGEARQHHTQQLFGTSDEQMRAFRQGVLNTTIVKLQELAQTYLKDALGQSSTAIISSEQIISPHAEALTQKGFVTHQI